MATFIGIDLAWRSDENPSCGVALRGDRNGASCISISAPIYSEQVRKFIATNESTESTIAIDAPLIIPNDVGQRLCETELGHRYGSRHASCHTTNATRYPNASSVLLASSLSDAGYVHAPCAAADCAKRMLEVYPHAAMVAMFDLPRIVKYKKGTVDQKRNGQKELVNLIRKLATATPRLIIDGELARLLDKDVDSIMGRSLKTNEDALDAAICAYLAYYYWFWQTKRNEFFGRIETGYIVNPILADRSPLSEPS